MKRIYNIFFLVVILSSAVMGGYMFLARFFHLTNGFQYDELYSIATATPSVGFSTIWHDMLLQDVNLPLFNILFLGWNYIFPITPFYAHLFSALLGALAVLAAYFFVPKTWPKLKKFIFVMLMSGSFILVAYGTNVRSYSLSVLLSTCFTLLALRLIGHFEKNEKIKLTTWLWFFITGLLGSYSHYFCAAVFFSAALVVFLYACYYHRGRAWSFYGTAFIFLLWVPWAIYALGMMGGAVPGGAEAAEWWYHTPFMLATWGIFVFLFGAPCILGGLVIFCVSASVSLISTYKGKILKQADIILPLAQTVLLCAIVGLVSVRFNLWMDRYFLPLLPPIFVLLASALYHLYTRQKWLIVLLPVLMFGWVHFYWNMSYVQFKEYTGLHEALTYLARPGGPKQVLVDLKHIGYSKKALEVMLNYYLPKDSHLQLITLTPQTASLALQDASNVPVLAVLCSHVRLMNMAVETKIDVSEKPRPRVFEEDVCLFQAKPIEISKEQMNVVLEKIQK